MNKVYSVSKNEYDLLLNTKIYIKEQLDHRRCFSRDSYSTEELVDAFDDIMKYKDSIFSENKTLTSDNEELKRRVKELEKALKTKLWGRAWLSLKYFTY